MDRDTLVALLDSAAKTAGKQIDAAFDGNRARWSYFSRDVAAPFGQALSEQVDLKTIENKRLTHSQSGVDAIFSSTAVYMVERATRMPASVIIDDLLRMAKELTIDEMHVQSIEGITINEDIQLSEDLWIRLPSSLPESDAAKFIFSEKNVPPHGFGKPPTCAIVKRRDNKVAVYEPPGPRGASIPMTSGNKLDDFQLALIALSIASDGAPVRRQAYTQILSPGWVGMTETGPFGSYSFPEFVPSCSPVAGDVAKRFFKRLKTIDQKLELAIKFLVASRTRLEAVDRLVDLGTCIEILLADDGDKAEIALKIGLRAAWLIGTTVEERLNLFEIAKGLYAGRSSAVHTGKPPRSKPGAPDLSSQMSKYDLLCRLLLIKLAEEGKPDWRALLLGFKK
jgi:hypothetical protein